jgi:hypothetical protein
MRAAVVETLNQQLGPNWTTASAADGRFDVATACALALGLCA